MGTYYVTKWALTKGILQVEGKLSSEFPDMLAVTTSGIEQYFHGPGREWHVSREHAEIQVGLLLSREVKRLQRKLEDLESKKFLDKVYHVSDWPKEKKA